MATAPETIDDLLALLKPIGGATAKKMFGEYCIYLDDKPVALVCDDCLYVKVTEPGRAMGKNIAESPPYSGAKPHLEYPIDSWGNGRHLCELLRATHAALPAKAARKAVSKSTARNVKPAATSKPRKPKK
mgnify:CR=1 FL=1